MQGGAQPIGVAAGEGGGARATGEDNAGSTASATATTDAETPRSFTPRKEDAILPDAATRSGDDGDMATGATTPAHADSPNSLATTEDTSLPSREPAPTLATGDDDDAGNGERSTSPARDLGTSSPSQARGGGVAASSSPAAAGAAGAAGSSPASTTSSASSSPSASSHAPSRRVKVYRLKDDAWIDLGTGTCTGEFLQSVPTTATLTEGFTNPGDEGAFPQVEEGAWILVKREKPAAAAAKKKKHNRGVAKAGDGSPVRKKKKKDDDDGSSSPPSSKAKHLLEEDEPTAGGKVNIRDDSDDSEDDDDDEEDDDSNLILRSRVQPYPPGMSPDELPDDDEVTSVDENGNVTIDAGGYQRQQETLIVWTERTLDENDEEQEMALSFATGSGCSEIWEFIKAARRYLGGFTPLGLLKSGSTG